MPAHSPSHQLFPAPRPVHELGAVPSEEEVHHARGRDEERGTIDDWVSVQAHLTARHSFDPPPSVTIGTSSPAVIDAAVQVRQLDFGATSVSTSTLGLCTGPVSSDVGTCTSEDGVLHSVVLRDIGCNTDPPPSLPGDATETEGDTDGDESVEDPPFVEQNVLPPPVTPDEDKSFKDVISFLRAHHDLGPMKPVVRKGLDSSWAKSARKGAPVPTGESFAMPLSALGVNLRKK